MGRIYLPLFLIYVVRSTFSFKLPSQQERPSASRAAIRR
jgi:hypothetical protein